MLRSYLFVIILFYCFSKSSGQCSIRNTSFVVGEKIVYDIAYNWQFVWISAGEVTFMVKNASYHGKQVYHFDSYGTSYKSYDWFYKVRDRYQAYADTASLQTLWAGRNTSEGGYEVFEDYSFNIPNKKVSCATKTSHIASRHFKFVGLFIRFNYGCILCQKY
jgi:hypothetical protein